MLPKMSAVPIVVVLLCLATTSLFASQEAMRYSMPLPGPEFGAPPRNYYDSPVISITFKTTPEALKKLVPEPMAPNPENIVSLYLGHFNAPPYRSGQYQFKGESYEEAGFVAPVTLGKQQGGYSLFLYLNQLMPAISGREIWGFPKKDADIVMTEENGKVTYTVKRLGATLIKATFEKTAKVEPIPNRPSRLRYNLKYIPSAKKNAPPDVMQITSYMQNNKLKQLWKGKATLELGNTSTDPLGEIPVLKIVNAEYIVMDGVVDYGDVAYDYLKAAEVK